MNKYYYIPSGQVFQTADMDNWFKNNLLELKETVLDDHEKEFLREYYQDAGLLTSQKRNFFSHHYSRPVSIAVNSIFEKNAHPKILDLGAGTGTQSILFAILGAEVLAVDMDELSLNILKKRKDFYQDLTGKQLNVTILNKNVFDINFNEYEKFDAVYSLFAFNMMQPSSRLLPILTDALTTNGKIIIQDGNKNNWYNRIFRKRDILSKKELYNIVSDLGFTRMKSYVGYVTPPFLWNLLPNGLLSSIDEALTNLSDLFPVSYLHEFKK